MYYPAKTEEQKIYDFIVSNEIATETEISLVTNINGWNVETLNSIIWCRTAYHDADQCLACEPQNFVDPYHDFSDDDDDETDGGDDE